MRVLTLKSMMTGILQKKVRLICVMLCSLCLFGLIGLKEVKQKQVVMDEAYQLYQQKLENYNAKLAEYDTTKAMLEQNLVTAEAQYNNQKEYCDNSIYMRLDSSAIQVAEMQFMVKMDEVEDPQEKVARIGYVGSNYANYITSGDFRKKVCEQMPELKEEYLKEIVSSWVSGNLVIVNISHFDRDVVEKIRDVAKEVIKKETSDIEKNQGRHELILINDQIVTRVDSGILNTQGNSLNALRNFATAANDIKKNMLTQDIDKVTYAEEKQPDVVYPFGKKGKIAVLIKDLVFGGILGVVLLAFMELCAVVFGKKIRSMDYFTALDIPVFEKVIKATGNDEESKKLITDIILSAKSNNAQNIYFESVSPVEDQKTEEAYQSFLSGTGERLQKEGGITVSCGRVSGGEDESLHRMAESDQIVLWVNKNVTRYADLENVFAYIKRYHCKVMQVVEWRV
ncbi:MAG: hypothetical protein K5739_05555 [Lachnospiraceae bacterium]|nr:hypothetical protein [Lachnospiraceae bacterium]